MIVRLALALVALLELPVMAYASEWYVAPTGTQTGAGTQASPWDLQTAFVCGSANQIKPGDIVWLMNGRYGMPIKRQNVSHPIVNDYIVKCGGSAAAPIIIRQMKGAHATIDIPSPVDSAIMVLADYVWFWGFEIMSSDPKRVTTIPGSFPDDVFRRGGPISSRKTGVKFINLITHDMRGGPGHGFEGGCGNEIYGVISYYNGWDGPERSHGHGIYTQNLHCVQPVENNITFKNFSHGLHLYGSDQAELRLLHLDNNTSFGNASISRYGIYQGRELLFGGGARLYSPTLRGNVVYGSQFNYGYGAGCTDDAIMTDNWVYAQFVLTNCAGTISGNYFYYDEVKQWGYHGDDLKFPDNTWSLTKPTDLRIFVRANKYERGRGHVTITNFGRQPNVSVDISSLGLLPGEAYEVRDVQDVFGPPVVTGNYSGALVSIPMTTSAVSKAIGNVPVAPVHTGIEFGVFLVLSEAFSTLPPPPPPPASQCADGIDNDKDGKIDVADPGCTTLLDNDETDIVGVPPPPPAACADGLDNDKDSLIDLDDPGCANAADTDETNVILPPPPPPPPPTQCADGFDNDKDGKVDLLDPGCTNAADNDETNVVMPPPPPAARDFIKPKVTLTSPKNGTVTGIVTLTAEATDNVGVAGVRFYISGNQIGAEDTQAPYSVTWDTSKLPLNWYLIVARARDASNNWQESNPGATVRVVR